MQGGVSGRARHNLADFMPKKNLKKEKIKKKKNQKNFKENLRNLKNIFIKKNIKRIIKILRTR